MSKWIEKELSSLCSIEKGDQLNKLALNFAGTYPCINGGVEPSGYTEKYNRPENTISISEGGNSCGYVNLMKEKFWAGGHCYTLQENGKLIDKNFLYFALKYNQERIMQLRVGSGLPNIQRNSLAEYKIRLPEDSEEQKRIAGILSKTDELIEATQTLIDKQKKIKTGLMQTLLTCGIDDNGTIRTPETHEFKDSELGPIPKEWECVELGKLSNKCLGKMLDSKKNKGKNKFYLRNENVQWQCFDMHDLDQMPFEEHETERYSIRKGDIVMCEGGEPGRCAVWETDNVEMYFQKALHRVRCKKDLLNHFLVYEFMYLNMNNVLSDYFTGTTIMHLTGMSLDNLPIKKPSPTEQDRIISILQQQDQVIKDLENEKQKYIDIKKGLMADLLTGKVKVPG